MIAAAEDRDDLDEEQAALDQRALKLDLELMRLIANMAAIDPSLFDDPVIQRSLDRIGRAIERAAAARRVTRH